MADAHVGNLLFLLVGHECLRWQERGVRPWLALAALVVLLAAWARLSGETLAGLILLGVYCAGAGAEWLRADTAPARQTARHKTLRLAGAGLLCAALAGLDPAGYRPLVEQVRFLFLALPRNWPGGYGTLDFQAAEARGFLIWLAAVFLFLVWQRPRLTPSAALVLVSWIGLAFYARRYVPVMIVLTAPVLAQSAGRKWWLGWGALAVAVLLAGRPLAAEPVPVNAVRFIRGQPAEFTGRLFNLPAWEGYVRQELPGQRVFIADVADIQAYRQIANLSTNWLELLDRSAVAWTLLPRRHCLNQGLRELANWRCAYTDDVAAVYRRWP
ncbi:MAG: hypothetical protein WCG79_04450 [Verrucomicrobiota bacterium]